jgi:hypothetical protein
MLEDGKPGFGKTALQGVILSAAKDLLFARAQNKSRSFGHAKTARPQDYTHIDLPAAFWLRPFKEKVAENFPRTPINQATRQYSCWTST